MLPMIGLFNFYNKNKEEKIKELKKFIEEETNVTLLNSESSLEGFDGIILSGSELLLTNGKHNEEWLELIRNTHVPTIGICFGFQLICLAFGAIFEHRELTKKPIAVRKFREHSLFNDIPEVANLPESHEDYVIAVMDPLIPIMYSNSCIEAVIHRDRPIFGTQFHFERSKEYGKTILKNFLKLLN